MKMRYKIGELVTLNHRLEKRVFDLLVENTGLNSESIGIIISYSKSRSTVGGKRIQYNGWYNVLFGDRIFDFEEWEIEEL